MPTPARLRIPMLVLIGLMACSTPPTAADAQAGDTPTDEADPPVDVTDPPADETGADAPHDAEMPVDDLPAPLDGERQPEVSRASCLLYSDPVVVGHLPEVVTEASGLAAFEGQATVLWIHNDSGDGPNLYAVDPDEGLLATITLAGTSAIDWEDMSRGPCEPGDASRACLYVGDVGDNFALRPWLVIYRVAPPLDPVGEVLLDDYELMSVVYPDGSRDAEALLVDDRAHVYVLTKDRGHEGTFRLYSAPFEAGGRRVELTAHGVVDFSSVAASEHDLVTAADYDPIRRRVIIRTYHSAVEFRLTSGSSVDNLSSAPLVAVPSADEPQGEAIAYGLNGYWHVSEGERQPIYYVECADH